MCYRFPYVGADLCYLVLSHTPAHTARLRTWASISSDEPVYFPSYLWVLMHLPTERWLRLSRPGCLGLHRGGLAILRWSPSLLFSSLLFSSLLFSSLLFSTGQTAAKLSGAEAKMVTHPGTNRAWRRVTMVIETNALPLCQTG